MSLNWFNTSIEGGIQTSSYTGNFKVVGDIEVTGLVRRNGEIFESIVPTWNPVSAGGTEITGRIYYNPGGNIDVLVGIGTSTPTVPSGVSGNSLVVNGNILYTGDIYKGSQKLDFGFGAWTGDKSGTIYYSNKVGIGSGFADGVVANGTLHVWDTSITQSSWNPDSGIRIGPQEINTPFTQTGVSKYNGKAWSWFQAARSLSNLSIDPIGNTLLINPAGGAVGIGVTSIDNIIDGSTLSITSYIGQTPLASGFRKTVALGPETHSDINSSVEYNSTIYSKRFAVGFRDTGDERGLHFMVNSDAVSWKNNSWQNSSIMTLKDTGEVGIGTANPRLRLEVSSTAKSGILISNPNFETSTLRGFGIQRTLTGLSMGPLLNNDTTVARRLEIINSGIKVTDTVEAVRYRVGVNDVLTGTTLGSTVVNSSLTNVGFLSNLNVSGNVGVGTNAPTSKLDVRGDINFTGILRQNGTPFQTGIGMFDWRNNLYTSFNQRRITQVFGRFGLELESEPSLGPFADFLYLNGWADSSGGERNILAMSKSGPPAIRLYRTPFSDTLDRTNYRDVVISRPSSEGFSTGFMGFEEFRTVKIYIENKDKVNNTELNKIVFDINSQYSDSQLGRNAKFRIYYVNDFDNPSNTGRYNDVIMQNDQGLILHPQVATTYVEFDGGDTTFNLRRRIGSEFNISSVVKTRIGEYRVNFSTAYIDDRYVAIVTAQKNSTTTQSISSPLLGDVLRDVSLKQVSDYNKTPSHMIIRTGNSLNTDNENAFSVSLVIYSQFLQGSGFVVPL